MTDEYSGLREQPSRARIFRQMTCSSPRKRLLKNWQSLIERLTSLSFRPQACLGFSPYKKGDRQAIAFRSPSCSRASFFASPWKNNHLEF